MNNEAKKMFEELYKYCNRYGYVIIEVYFQHKKAIICNFSNISGIVVYYKNGVWE